MCSKSTEKLTKPPFPYPADIPQPRGAKGWGFRNPCATYQTLLWEQNRPAMLMPNRSPQRIVNDAWLSTPSGPVNKKLSSPCAIRPPVEEAAQRPQATSLYANWASVLQA